MPRRSGIFGTNLGSYYESDFEVQYNHLIREFDEYKDFIYKINEKWQDDRKNEFFKKHINDCSETADSYIFNCEKLIMYIEEARKIEEI